MKSDADLIVLRLFENTSYQVADDVPDEKIASMDQMRQFLVGMADGAVRRSTSDLISRCSDRAGLAGTVKTSDRRTVPAALRLRWNAASVCESTAVPCERVVHAQ
jgi:hypothetical protein